MSNLYALLVGINCYLPNKLSNGLFYNSLWGCVQDVLRVEDFLRSRLGLSNDRLIKLTSSRTESGTPSEPLEKWPTYENMVNAFKELTKRAQPGDQVYIHYSGHGGRTPTTEPFYHLKGSDGIDEVLVPMDLGNSEGRYLRDTELQHLLKRMVDRGLVVTVVLDSCHAGGATRAAEPVVTPESNGVTVRGIGEIDTTPRPLNSLVAAPQQLVQTWESLTNGVKRSVQTGSGWFLEPKGYVLLAACCANEYANEVVFEGNEKNGALSYWLVDSLKQMGPGFTYEMLHDRILAKVHGQFREQTPQLQGEGSRVVLGTHALLRQHAVIVTEITPDQVVVLNAGQSHGLHRGARFSLYPLHETDFSEINRRIALVEISELGAVSSNAKILNQTSSQAIEPGCRAVLLDTGRAQLRRRVRLIEPEGVAKAAYSSALANVESEFARRPEGFIGLAAPSESPDFIVTVNTGDEYVICDAGGNAIPNLRPALRYNDCGTAARLADRLVHLAKYASVRALNNNDSRSALTRELVVDLTGVQENYRAGEQPEPQPFETAGDTHLVRDGEWTFLRIKNNHAHVVFVSVLDLQPDWGISQIYPARAGAFEPVDPGRELTLPLRVTLPAGYKSGVDIIKVFGTLETTSFRWLELPVLDQPQQSDSSRGVLTNPLEELLSAFSSAGSLTRQVDIPTLANLEWVAHQVEIEIQPKS